MAKKKPDRGVKSEWIRSALKENPSKRNKEIVALLNKKAEDEEMDMKFTPQDVAGIANKNRTIDAIPMQYVARVPAQSHGKHVPISAVLETMELVARYGPETIGSVLAELEQKRFKKG